LKIADWKGNFQRERDRLNEAKEQIMMKQQMKASANSLFKVKQERLASVRLGNE